MLNAMLGSGAKFILGQFLNSSFAALTVIAKAASAEKVMVKGFLRLAKHVAELTPPTWDDNFISDIQKELDKNYFK